LELLWRVHSICRPDATTAVGVGVDQAKIWIAAFVPRSNIWITAGILCLGLLAGIGGARAQQAAQISNEICLGCHGNEGFAMPGVDGQMRSLYVAREKFEQSVHGKRLCVECHKNITGVPHEKTEVRVGCVQCHQDLWNSARKDNKAHEFARLGEVVEQIERYMKSIHARPNIQDQSRTNATCYNCHDAHYVYPAGSTIRTEWRLNIPNTCGKCHVRERELYATSVHGKEVLEKHNTAAAICSDCHTTHDVGDPAKDVTKLVITKNCGGCHSDSFKTYTQTYHGQVQTLGYAYTAKCFDCHGSHTIQRVNDPASSVHANHRLQTCQTCHQHATAGFATFQPHANSHDFARYPYTWIASKFMLGLLGGTFAFFWTHTGLWFYREYKERKEGRNRPHVRVDELLHAPRKYYQRWGLVWRIAHLAFALSLMMLVLTGMTAFYADSAWAPIVVKAFGGPKVTAAIHRVCAVVFLGVFLAHLVYVVIHIGRNWRTFKWFGPRSLIPNWQDLKDIVAMFLWFFGRWQRPVFDRWTYWEKFDYWAPFWGVTIIGASGLMLWMPTITASILPGWVFNVATIAHGEEAVLAAGFLFTVHFFNNHFRPDKFPLDIVMFTGAMPLEEFKREHTLEFQRLVETGQLEKYLVDAPSRPMTLGSKILGFTLIAVGLILLILVAIGFIGSVTGE
jgi:cytochrome b subunit of formate dehydrogenase